MFSSTGFGRKVKVYELLITLQKPVHDYTSTRSISAKQIFTANTLYTDLLAESYRRTRKLIKSHQISASEDISSMSPSTHLLIHHRQILEIGRAHV